MYIELTSLTTLVNPVNYPMPVIQKFYSQVNVVLNPSSFISSNGCYQKCLNKTAKKFSLVWFVLGCVPRYKYRCKHHLPYTDYL